MELSQDSRLKTRDELTSLPRLGLNSIGKHSADARSAWSATRSSWLRKLIPLKGLTLFSTISRYVGILVRRRITEEHSLRPAGHEAFISEGQIGPAMDLLPSTSHYFQHSHHPYIPAFHTLQQQC